MGYDFQVVIDCTDPHVLADWWAEALAWRVEPQDEAFIRRMIDEGHATAAETTTHRGNLVWAEGAAIGDETTGRRIYFQAVPEAKTVKNRVHLDIRVGADRVESEVERLVGMGAVFLHRGRQGPHSWVTIADPAGNELCIT